MYTHTYICTRGIYSHSQPRLPTILYCTCISKPFTVYTFVSMWCCGSRIACMILLHLQTSVFIPAHVCTSCPSIHPSIHPSIVRSMDRSMFLSSICLSTSLSSGRSTYLSMHQSVDLCPFICDCNVCTCVHSASDIKGNQDNLEPLQTLNPKPWDCKALRLQAFPKGPECNCHTP